MSGGQNRKSSYLHRDFAPGPLPCHTYSNGDFLPPLHRLSKYLSTNFLNSEKIHTDEVSPTKKAISEKKRIKFHMNSI